MRPRLGSGHWPATQTRRKLLPGRRTGESSPGGGDTRDPHDRGPVDCWVTATSATVASHSTNCSHISHLHPRALNRPPRSFAVPAGWCLIDSRRRSIRQQPPGLFHTRRAKAGPNPTSLGVGLTGTSAFGHTSTNTDDPGAGPGESTLRTAGTPRRRSRAARRSPPPHTGSPGPRPTCGPAA